MAADKATLVKAATLATMSQRKDVERIVDAFLCSAAQELIATGRLELRGFGTFIIRTRPGHSTKHPTSGQRIDVPAVRFVSFRASTSVRAVLNEES